MNKYLLYSILLFSMLTILSCNYDGINMNISSSVSMLGTEAEPIIINPETPGIGWGTISLKGPAERLDMEYVHMTDGILTSYDTQNSIAHCRFENTQDLDWQYAIIRFWYGSLSVTDNYFKGVNKAEGVLMHDVNDAIVARNEFTKVPDAIELISGVGGEFYDNVIKLSNDDGIDLNGCVNTQIYNNRFEGISDAALEIGSENFGRTVDAVIRDNYIDGCSKGIWLKESSTVHALRDTFLNNMIAIDIITPDDSLIVSEMLIEKCFFDKNDQDIVTDNRSEYTIIN